jgi:ribokinase
MTERPRIAIVGSNMIDLITGIDRMPKKGETVVAPWFDMGFGGKGANQAVAAALLGAEVVMVTKVGDDIFGQEVKKNFASFGIDTEYVESVPGVSNGVAPIFVDQEGNNYILIIKGANSHLKEKDIERASKKIAGCDLILLQLEIPLESVYYAIELGERIGIPVILNPAPAVQLDEKYLRKLSVLIPNETELEILTGMPVETLPMIRKAAGELLRRGVKTVIATLGENGALIVKDDGENHVPALHVKPKDTTGAGDAFIGGFAYYFLKTNDLLNAVRYANCYAALSTLKPGTQKSFLKKDEFEDSLKNIDFDSLRFF